uniref:Apoptosis inhibitor 5 n=1 Tax=Gorilla gorilla gorilla TaxID=9595 RepID=A0A2I2ZV37_GORGO
VPKVEELYRNYGILADAMEQVVQHKNAYEVIPGGVKGGTKEKRLVAQFIPKFFKQFPELADSAINALLDLCEDEDTSAFFSIVVSLIYINSTTHWIAGDVPLKRLLPSAKNLMFFIPPLYV